LPQPYKQKEENKTLNSNKQKKTKQKRGVHHLSFLQIEKEVQERSKEKAIPSLNPLGPYKKKRLI
jgi:hypothetical protein